MPLACIVMGESKQSTLAYEGMFNKEPNEARDGYRRKGQCKEREKETRNVRVLGIGNSTQYGPIYWHPQRMGQSSWGWSWHTCTAFLLRLLLLYLLLSSSSYFLRVYRTTGRFGFVSSHELRYHLCFGYDDSQPLKDAKGASKTESRVFNAPGYSCKASCYRSVWKEDENSDIAEGKLWLETTRTISEGHMGRVLKDSRVSAADRDTGFRFRKANVQERDPNQ